ncbi:hypothetical protein CAPTEDRAFT_105332 [Capitella teleta]|uniref:Alpha-ketoglutarate-dependent dioxygenase alkB homolog 3 n=1 Tax=Capitella teleta TaxID=283909 RepID=R7TGH9_CAPTE|nr:hypothetical protein CAPTEDRAFT_105332 [Capitella teleta]|eukprot:ELT92602.1 hypothetical protein CAPTEDRAFT_105332 [Capitella teleta]
MSSDRRRRARVQGGWAAPVPAAAAAAAGKGKEKAKLASPSPPAWLGKNVDHGPAPQKFLFKEPQEVILKYKLYIKAGVYDISSEPSGVARVRLFPSFIEANQCEWMYEQLFSELPWRQRSDVKSGVSYLQPRLTAWFGDFPYSYSGVRHEGNKNWPPILAMLKEKLEENTGCKFNSVLANLYRNGHDHVPWHSDDESQLGNHPTIASLSFGDLRLFELRKKAPLELRANLPEDYQYTEYVRVPLDAGTLLIMEGACQEDWQHRIKREYHDRGPRINLTFRVIHPETE